MLLETAPHRVWPMHFGVPVYEDSRVGALRVRAGLILYDLLAGKLAPCMEHKHFGKEDFAAHFPLLATTGLKAGFTYGDAQTDDARLVLELVDGAQTAGAACVNYCRMESILEEHGQAAGAVLQDRLSGTELTVQARQIVNATGYWMAREADHLCRLTKGAHLVMPGCGLEEALLLTAKSDGRVFFIIPWCGRTLLGTTDTDYNGDLENVRVDSEDIAYLLAAANGYLKQAWTEKDVIGSFAGLRALKYSDVAAPSAVSRGWKLEVAPNGVHYSIGGKLTSAREDAASIVDVVCSRLGELRPCLTAGKRFPWAPADEAAMAALEADARQAGLDAESARWLVRRHGKRAAAVIDTMKGNPELAGRIVADLPMTLGDLLFCAREEMAMHLDDLLRRRMPLLILAHLTYDEVLALARRIAPLLGWDETRTAQEVERCASPPAAG